MRYCQNCGAQVHNGDHFCQNCGAPIQSENTDTVMTNSVRQENMIRKQRSGDSGSSVIQDEHPDNYQQNISNILISTTEHIPNHNYTVLGEVFGVTTQSRDVISNMGAGLKNIVGGEIKGYTKMLMTSREDAISRMCAEAQSKGADAIVMMRFDSGSIGGDMQSVVAYGTAVKFVDKEKN